MQVWEHICDKSSFWSESTNKIMIFVTDMLPNLIFVLDLLWNKNLSCMDPKLDFVPAKTFLFFFHTFWICEQIWDEIYGEITLPLISSNLPQFDLWQNHEDLPQIYLVESKSRTKSRGTKCPSTCKFTNVCSQTWPLIMRIWHRFAQTCSEEL